MKKLKTLAIVLSTIVVTSCSNDDDNSGNISSDLVGIWNITTLVSEQPLDINEDGTASTMLHTEIDCVIEQFVFNDDGTWSGSSSFAILFAEELQSVLCLDENRVGTWSIEGNSLAITSTSIGGTRTFTITLTQNSLSFDLLQEFIAGPVIGTYIRE